ncbi:MAG: RidA family protein [Gammaproteobacteria bacterium]|nr:RidA family protein [Gammaproteobacteria bacterium]
MNREIINPWKWQDQFGFVQANNVTEASRTLYCSGQASMAADGNPLHAGDMAAQIELTLDNLETVLAQADMELKDIVRLNYYTTDPSSFMQSIHLITERFTKAGCRPASTLLGVASLFHPDIMIEIDATAVR